MTHNVLNRKQNFDIEQIIIGFTILWTTTMMMMMIIIESGTKGL